MALSRLCKKEDQKTLPEIIMIAKIFFTFFLVNQKQKGHIDMVAFRARQVVKAAR